MGFALRCLWEKQRKQKPPPSEGGDTFLQGAPELGSSCEKRDYFEATADGGDAAEFGHERVYVSLVGEAARGGHDQKEFLVITHSTNENSHVSLCQP